MTEIKHTDIPKETPIILHSTPRRPAILPTLASMAKAFPDYVLAPPVNTKEMLKAIQIYQDRMTFLMERAEVAEDLMLQRLVKHAPELNFAERVYKLTWEGDIVIARDMGPRVRPWTPNPEPQSEVDPETSHP